MAEYRVLDLDSDLAVVAAWPHSGVAADLVRELKYGRATGVVTELAGAMVTARRRRRGFDQGELLARAIARRLGLPIRKALRRVDDEPQTSRRRDGRLLGPQFAGGGRRLRFTPTVLLVDDVVTTGSTLRSAAEVLRSRGAGRVCGLVATHALAPVRTAEHPSGV